jgi:hypothetical protein
LFSDKKVVGVFTFFIAPYFVYNLLSETKIPPCLKGIAAIDASTSRALLLVYKQWRQLYLIEAAKAANIQKFIPFSSKCGAI